MDLAGHAPNRTAGQVSTSGRDVPGRRMGTVPFSRPRGVPVVVRATSPTWSGQRGAVAFANQWRSVGDRHLRIQDFRRHDFPGTGATTACNPGHRQVCRWNAAARCRGGSPARQADGLGRRLSRETVSPRRVVARWRAVSRSGSGSASELGSARHRSRPPARSWCPSPVWCPRPESGRGHPQPWPPWSSR